MLYALRKNQLGLPLGQHPMHDVFSNDREFENLNIQPSKKIWKMEGDGSLAPPLTGQGRLLDKGRGGYKDT